MNRYLVWLADYRGRSGAVIVESFSLANAATAFYRTLIESQPGSARIQVESLDDGTVRAFDLSTRSQIICEEANP